MRFPHTLSPNPQPSLSNYLSHSFISCPLFHALRVCCVLSCPGQVLTLLCLRFLMFFFCSVLFLSCLHSAWGALNTCSTKFNKQRTCLVYRPPASPFPAQPVSNSNPALRVRRPSTEAAGSLNLLFFLLHFLFCLFIWSSLSVAPFLTLKPNTMF